LSNGEGKGVGADPSRIDLKTVPSTLAIKVINAILYTKNVLEKHDNV